MIGSQDQEKGEEDGRWIDDITMYIGTATWERVARTRTKWKTLEEGFTQQWVKQPLR